MGGIFVIVLAVLAAAQSASLKKDKPDIQYELTNEGGPIRKPVLTVANIQISQLIIPLKRKQIDVSTQEALIKLLQSKIYTRRDFEWNEDGVKIFKVDEPGHPGTVVEVDGDGNVKVRTAEQAYAENDPNIVPIRRADEENTTQDFDDDYFYFDTSENPNDVPIRRADEEDTTQDDDDDYFYFDASEEPEE